MGGEELPADVETAVFSSIATEARRAERRCYEGLLSLVDATQEEFLAAIDALTKAGYQNIDVMMAAQSRAEARAEGRPTTAGATSSSPGRTSLISDAEGPPSSPRRVGFDRTGSVSTKSPARRSIEDFSARSAL